MCIDLAEGYINITLVCTNIALMMRGLMTTECQPYGVLTHSGVILLSSDDRHREV